MMDSLQFPDVSHEKHPYSFLLSPDTTWFGLYSSPNVGIINHMFRDHKPINNFKHRLFNQSLTILYLSLHFGHLAQTPVPTLTNQFLFL